MTVVACCVTRTVFSKKRKGQSVPNLYNSRKYRQFYRTLAEQCERSAMESKVAEVRQRWLEIAEGYRAIIEDN